MSTPSQNNGSTGPIFLKTPFKASEDCFVGMAKYILNCKAGTDNDDDLVGKEILITSVFGSILY